MAAILPFYHIDFLPATATMSLD